METILAALEHSQAEERAAVEAQYNAQQEQEVSMLSTAIDEQELSETKETVKKTLENVRILLHKSSF